MSHKSDDVERVAAKMPGRDALRPALPRRFYKTAVHAAEDGGFAVRLDGRTAKTPGKRALIVGSEPLAQALAEEWGAQGERIDPEAMPLTRFVNTAIDGVAGNEAAVRGDIVGFASSDLLCYRAEGPAELVAEQARHWDGVLAWSRERFGARFVVTTGVMPKDQPKDAIDPVASHLAGLDAFELTALHFMTTLTGSALLALAHAAGHLDVTQAWAAAHVDEDWQTRLWGEDTEAAERRERRWRDMQAASRLLELLRG